METRPLASIFFVNVETKRSILLQRLSLLHATDHELSPRTYARKGAPTGWMGAWRSRNLGPLSRSAPCHVPCPVRSGHHGILWDFMVVNGFLRNFLANQTYAQARRRECLPLKSANCSATRDSTQSLPAQRETERARSNPGRA
jgi:hypothetical protein